MSALNGPDLSMEAAPVYLSGMKSRRLNKSMNCWWHGLESDCIDVLDSHGGLSVRVSAGYSMYYQARQILYKNWAEVLKGMVESWKGTGPRTPCA